MSDKELSPEVREHLFPKDIVARQLEIVDTATRVDDIPSLLNNPKYSHLEWYTTIDAIDYVESLYDRTSRKLSKTGRDLIKLSGWVIGGEEANRNLKENQRTASRLAYYYEYFEELKKYQAIQYGVQILLSGLNPTEQAPNGDTDSHHAHAA